MIRIWRQCFIALAWLILLAGCTPRSGSLQLSGPWPLDAADLPVVVPTRPSPQTPGTSIPWHVSVRGKADNVVYEFIISDGKNEVKVQKGKSAEWHWQPNKPGKYRVKVIAEDKAGHRMEGDWSQDYRIVPTLHLVSLLPDKSSPQKAGMPSIDWEAVAKGGVKPLTYDFISRRVDDNEHIEQLSKSTQLQKEWYKRPERNSYDQELIEQRGKSPSWRWRPLDRGKYLISVRVHDAAGNIVILEHPARYEILASLGHESLIAVLPVQNLSGAAAPVEKIREHLKSIMRQKGLQLVDEHVLQDFITRHRIRYTAGIDTSTTLALRQETGATAVLLSTVELYRQGDIPKISLTAWLDKCGSQPFILWMDSKSMTGDESPGLLDLGMIRNADKLLDKVTESLFKSWDPTLMPATSAAAAKHAAAYWMQRWGNFEVQKFRPQKYYRSKFFSPNQRYKVAVMPFYNLSERKYAGELMELQFIRQLRQAPNLTVVDPGELRQYLLRYRIIMEDGLSLANAEVLFAKLGVDLIVSGKIFDYQDYAGMIGKPIVDFSVEVFGREGNKTLWTSKSYGDGERGVFFFDLGKVYTAHNLAGQMVGTIARMMEQ